MLTEEEREYLSRRLADTAPKGTKHWDWDSLKVMAKDPTLYTFSLYWICHGIGGFGIGFALPTVIYQLGFTTTTKSQLMNMVSDADRTQEPCNTDNLQPPYISAFLLLNTLGFMLHRKWIRPWVTAVSSTSSPEMSTVNGTIADLDSRVYNHNRVHHPTHSQQPSCEVPCNYRGGCLCGMRISSHLA